jgi:hypothetical protein
VRVGRLVHARDDFLNERRVAETVEIEHQHRSACWVVAGGNVDVERSREVSTLDRDGVIARAYRFTSARKTGPAIATIERGPSRGAAFGVGVCRGIRAIQVEHDFAGIDGVTFPATCGGLVTACEECEHARRDERTCDQQPRMHRALR